MEVELQAHLSRGDLRGAAERLVRAHGPDVLGLCAAMVRDRDVAEDLAQDVFARAFAALDGYRAEASSRTWILTIARNRCLDHLRRQHRSPWANDAGGVDPDDHYADDAPLPAELLADRDDLARALAALGESERALVILRFGHGLEYSELAGAFGLREGTARMRVSRALARMRETLSEPTADVTASGLAASAVTADAVAQKRGRGGLLGRIFGRRSRAQTAPADAEQGAAAKGERAAAPVEAPAETARAPDPSSSTRAGRAAPPPATRAPAPTGAPAAPPPAPATPPRAMAAPPSDAWDGGAHDEELAVGLADFALEEHADDRHAGEGSFADALRSTLPAPSPDLTRRLAALVAALPSPAP